MRWGAAILAVMAVAVLAGCGRGGHQPEEELAHAGQHLEDVKGELLLAEVEYARASFREAPEQLSGDLPKVARARRADVREAHHLQAECHEGDGLESCDSIEAIEEVVEELDQEVKSE